jgi:alcohol dehydrogenase (cytochrome c)/quinohemoprotein ethanol dehydrogenase
MNFRSVLALVTLAALSVCIPAHAGDGAAAVTTERLANANTEPDNWLTYGRTHDEQRFSPLEQINATNVGKLGLAWFADLDTARGQEATPIVVDGNLYVSTAWSMVKAFDAATGSKLWEYDPKVPRERLVKLCCDAVNRGVAVYAGMVIVATIDGRLVALDAASGKEVWVTRTFPEDSDYTITGAPRVVKGRVVIGSSGSEYNARGFISAYDASSGKQVWRFHTVPGNPADGFENAAMEAAAKTWTGEWWKVGGGGTVWDSITYEPALNLIYFGTGNAEPWVGTARSPNGEDNLYTSSIVAIDADTGAYKWHFQETPQDRWDFDSDQQIIVATLKLGGADRRVLLHAPKNGFFYVLDAATGEFVSGAAFTEMNWASGLDTKGRPIYEPAAFYDKNGEPFFSIPGAAGAHSWQPMSFSPKTGLVYIPVNLAGWPYAAAKDWKQTKLGFQTGIDVARLAMPADPKVRADYMAQTTGELLAWDPVAQKAGWRVPYPGPWNGGTLATAGNLVFQGTAGGSFNAYSADKGTQLWSFPTQTGVIAAPMTYAIAGEQYVAILAGWGGVWDVAGSVLARKSGAARNISRLLVFKLGAKQQLPPVPPMAKLVLDPPAVSGTSEQIAAGADAYGRYCMVCHGDAAIAGGLNPDLRHSSMINSAAGIKAIVIDGALQHNGMVSFQSEVTPATAEAIRLYVIKRANEDKTLAEK